MAKELIAVAPIADDADGHFRSRLTIGEAHPAGLRAINALISRVLPGAMAHGVSTHSKT
jgi:hypothetical protein